MKLEDILLALLVLSFTIQILYFGVVFTHFIFYKPKPETTNNLPVSVVIVAHNEYHHLIKTLDPILKQDYPKFEVVVVNDNSDDESHYLLKELEKAHAHLKVVQINQNLNFFKGKKFPLSIGIKSASYDTLLHTNADCEIPSNQWIKSMQGAFQDKTEIVLGYAPYKPESGFLNKLIRFDTFTTAMNYFSLALLNKAYKGVGRNLAYSKRLFYQKSGFINHYKINLGDDDLFVNQASNKTNTEICIAPDSYTFSVAEKRFGTWLKQKKQQAKTSRFYKNGQRLFLVLFPLSLLFFYVLSLALLILKAWLIVVLVLFVLRLTGFLLIQKSGLRKLNEQKLLLLSPILELVLYTVLGILMGLNIFNQKDKWN